MGSISDERTLCMICMPNMYSAWTGLPMQCLHIGFWSHRRLCRQKDRFVQVCYSHTVIGCAVPIRRLLCAAMCVSISSVCRRPARHCCDSCVIQIPERWRQFSGLVTLRVVVLTSRKSRTQVIGFPRRIAYFIFFLPKTVEVFYGPVASKSNSFSFLL